MVRPFSPGNGITGDVMGVPSFLSEAYSHTPSISKGTRSWGSPMVLIEVSSLRISFSDFETLLFRKIGAKEDKDLRVKNI
jgi:hypothetical protein